MADYAQFVFQFHKGTIRTELPELDFDLADSISIP